MFDQHPIMELLEDDSLSASEIRIFFAALLFGTTRLKIPKRTRWWAISQLKKKGILKSDGTVADKYFCQDSHGAIHGTEECNPLHHGVQSIAQGVQSIAPDSATHCTGSATHCTHDCNSQPSPPLNITSTYMFTNTIPHPSHITPPLLDVCTDNTICTHRLIPPPLTENPTPTCGKIATPTPNDTCSEIPQSEICPFLAASRPQNQRSGSGNGFGRPNGRSSIVEAPRAQKTLFPNLSSAETQSDRLDSGDDGNGEQAVGGFALSAPIGPKELIEMWNRIGCRPKVMRVTKERIRKSQLRIRERPDPEFWSQLFHKVKQLNKPWMNFDFVIKSETNMTRIMEGCYDDWERDKSKTRGGQPKQQWQSLYEEYNREQNQLFDDLLAAFANIRPVNGQVVKDFLERKIEVPPDRRHIVEKWEYLRKPKEDC